MKLKVKYFGMIAEKVRCSDEELELDFTANFDLKAFFETKYPEIKEMNYKIAIEQEFCDFLEKEKENIEIALLPPFAGG